MHQQIDAAQISMTRPAGVADLSVIRSELDLQRNVRIDHLNTLTVGDSSTAADGSRLQVNRVLRLTAESALAEIDAALGRLASGSFGNLRALFRTDPTAAVGGAADGQACTRCHYSTRSGRAPRVQVAQARVRR